MTTLLIPGENDSTPELKKLAQFIAGISSDIPWHISRFHPDYKMLDKPLTSLDSIERAVEIGRDAGLKYIYTGNIRDSDTSGDSDISNTKCPNCGALLVSRSDFATKIENLDVEAGTCLKCGSEIAGVWS